jgi:hypothetical protein
MTDMTQLPAPHSDAPPEGDDIVLFGGSPEPALGAAAEHSWFSRDRRLLARHVDDVKADMDRVSGQLDRMLENLPRDQPGYELDSITVHLGFSAQGRVVFIAEAGIDASIEFTFTKRR